MVVCDGDVDILDERDPVFRALRRLDPKSLTRGSTTICTSSTL